MGKKKRIRMLWGASAPAALALIALAWILPIPIEAQVIITVLGACAAAGFGAMRVVSDR